MTHMLLLDRNADVYRNAHSRGRRIATVCRLAAGALGLLTMITVVASGRRADGAEQSLVTGGAAAAWMDALQSMQATVLWAILLAGGAVIVALLLLPPLAAKVADDAIEAAASEIEALLTAANGARPATSGGDARVRLRSALDRFVRVQSANARAAGALAEGSVRGASSVMTATDPVGVAIAQVAASMEAMTQLLRRATRGDLSATIVQRSTEDAMGRALGGLLARQSAMARELSARQTQASVTADQLRAASLALVEMTGRDAERLSRAAVRISYLAMQTQAELARVAGAERRAEESHAFMDAGSVALRRAIGGARELVMAAGRVQSVARDAGLLAVNGAVRARSATTGVDTDGAARALAEQAAGVASQLGRMMITGTDAAHDAGVAMDQVTAGATGAASVVRESREAASDRLGELLQLNESMSQLHEAWTCRAEQARRLVGQIDALSMSSRRDDIALRTLAARGTRAPLQVAV